MAPPPPTTRSAPAEPWRSSTTVGRPLRSETRAPALARRRNVVAIVAAGVLIAAVLAAALAPWLPLLDPDTVDTPNRLRPPLSSGHALGTDEFGRDLLARLVWGARVSLLAGVATAAASMLLGVALGVPRGLFTRWVEPLLLRAADIPM